MLKLASNAGLIEKPRFSNRLPLSKHHFDREWTLKIGVNGSQYGPHSATSNLRYDLITRTGCQFLDPCGVRGSFWRPEADIECGFVSGR